MGWDIGGPNHHTHTHTLYNYEHVIVWCGFQCHWLLFFVWPHTHTHTRQAICCCRCRAIAEWRNLYWFMLLPLSLWGGYGLSPWSTMRTRSFPKNLMENGRVHVWSWNVLHKVHTHAHTTTTNTSVHFKICWFILLQDNSQPTRSGLCESLLGLSHFVDGIFSNVLQ